MSKVVDTDREYFQKTSKIFMNILGYSVYFLIFYMTIYLAHDKIQGLYCALLNLVKDTAIILFFLKHISKIIVRRNIVEKNLIIAGYSILSANINVLIMSFFAIDFDAMIFSVFSTFLGCCILCNLIAMSDHEKEIKKHMKKIEDEKKDLEMYFTTLQLNPHFLFNTLNIIYIQCMKNNAEMPAEMIMQLSDLLRYQLYEDVKKKVMVKSELKFIEDYIELQKMRTQDVEVLYKKNFHCANVMIYPFLFTSYMENAFKYVGKNKHGEKYIKINFDIDEEYLFFALQNSKGLITKNPNKNEGIGIKNSKKRLDLMYNGKYDLNITETEDEFNVELKIDLKND